MVLSLVTGAESPDARSFRSACLHIANTLGQCFSFSFVILRLFRLCLCFGLVWRDSP